MSSSSDNFHFQFKNAHPKAQAFMKDSFFWDPTQETSPFGNDDGHDAAYGFREWRTLNKFSNPVNYLNELMMRWKYPIFEYTETDTNKIKAFITSNNIPDEAIIQQRIQEFKSAMINMLEIGDIDDNQLRVSIIATMQEMGIHYLTGQDNAIIAIGFAQFVLEGEIHTDLHSLTSTALKRQSLPLLIDYYSPDYRENRKQQLAKMLSTIKQITT